MAQVVRLCDRIAEQPRYYFDVLVYHLGEPKTCPVVAKIPLGHPCYVKMARLTNIGDFEGTIPSRVYLQYDYSITGAIAEMSPNSNTDFSINTYVPRDSYIVIEMESIEGVKSLTIMIEVGIALEEDNDAKSIRRLREAWRKGQDDDFKGRQISSHLSES